MTNYKDALGNELDCSCNSTDKNCFSFPVPPNDQYLGFECQNNGVSNVGQANLQCITNKTSTQVCIKAVRSSATFPTLDCTNGKYSLFLNLFVKIFNLI